MSNETPSKNTPSNPRFPAARILQQKAAAPQTYGGRSKNRTGGQNEATKLSDVYALPIKQDTDDTLTSPVSLGTSTSTAKKNWASCSFPRANQWPARWSSLSAECLLAA